MGIDKDIELALLRKENEDLKLNLLVWEKEWNPRLQSKIKGLEDAVVVMRGMLIGLGYNMDALDGILSKFLESESRR